MASLAYPTLPSPPTPSPSQRSSSDPLISGFHACLNPVFLLSFPPFVGMDFVAKPPNGSSPSPSPPAASLSSSSSSSLSSSSPCAACKLLRRRCVENCIFAPHFPADDPLKFACVHRVFGASNVSKMLQEVTMEQRGDAVSSLVYEANARIRDPVYGCVGAIANLQRQVLQLQTQLAVSQAQSVYAQLQCQILIPKSSGDPSSPSPPSHNLLNSLNIDDTNHNNNNNRKDENGSGEGDHIISPMSSFGPNDAHNDLGFLNQANILSVTENMDDDSSVLMSPTTPSTHNHLFHSLHSSSPPTPLLSDHYAHHLTFNTPSTNSNSYGNN